MEFNSRNLGILKIWKSVFASSIRQNVRNELAVSNNSMYLFPIARVCPDIDICDVFFNLWKGKIAGVISTFAFSLYGFLLKPDTIQRVFALPDEAYYKANVALGWISPLNHATYHMHNFGYDLLPKLWQSFLAFAVCILIGVYCTIRVSSRYNFCFSET